jgi:uncharacterized protein YjiS (DUF1127 family)
MDAAFTSLPTWGFAGFTFVARLAAACSRYVTRRHLARLDERLLADVAIPAEAARREAEKPFWRG